MTDTIDINCDLGEDMGDDAAMLDIVSSVNVACGFHAGGPDTMAWLARETLARNIALGAHPAFADRNNFGRTYKRITDAQLRNLLLYQIGALQAIAMAAGTELTHVRTHGALANMSEAEPAMAAVIAQTIKKVAPKLALMSRPHSATDIAARQLGVPIVRQGFADRAYQDNGALVPRSQAGAVLTDATQIAERVVQMTLEHKVKSLSGKLIDLPVETVCVHGDTPGAVVIAETIRKRLENNGIGIKAFC